jgi:hypothetical protein
MLALGVLALVDAEVADIAGAVTPEGLLRPFLAAVHAVRPHRGQAAVAAHVRAGEWRRDQCEPPGGVRQGAGPVLAAPPSAAPWASARAPGPVRKKGPELSGPPPACLRAAPVAPVHPILGWPMSPLSFNRSAAPLRFEIVSYPRVTLWSSNSVQSKQGANIPARLSVYSLPVILRHRLGDCVSICVDWL